MTWLHKTPTELFKTIPKDILEDLIIEKQQYKKTSIVSNLELINQLMSRHILNKYHIPSFVCTQEDLIRWLFCIYIIE